MTGGEPQPILSPLTEAAVFLVLTIEPGGEAAVRDLLADASGLRRSVGFRIPEGELTCVVGIGGRVWERLFGSVAPAQLRPFRELAGARHRAPATAGDVLFHIRAHRFDLCFELAQRLTAGLAGSAQVVDEVHGFRSFDERDLLGFVDGTENPAGEAASAAVLIGDEDPAFAGGSYVMVQKYVHDLNAWDALTVEEQELAIGRTKLSDLELSDEDKPDDSHVALNTIIDERGGQRQILRHNMPFGRVGVGEFGTYYIAYARSPEVMELMLSNMFLGKGAAQHDRILDFSTAVTGNLFFVPTVDFLDDPPSPGDPGQAAVAVEDGDDQSLGIGSLRGPYSVGSSPGRSPTSRPSVGSS